MSKPSRKYEHKNKGPAFSSNIIQPKSFQRYLGHTIYKKPAVVEGDRSQFGETNHQRVVRQRQGRDARRRAGAR